MSSEQRRLRRYVRFQAMLNMFDHFVYDNWGGEGESGVCGEDGGLFSEAFDILQNLNSDNVYMHDDWLDDNDEDTSVNDIAVYDRLNFINALPETLKRIPPNDCSDVSHHVWQVLCV